MQTALHRQQARAFRGTSSAATRPVHQIAPLSSRHAVAAPFQQQQQRQNSSRVRAIELDFSDPDTQLSVAGVVLGLLFGLGAPAWYINRTERDEERLEELRALNRAQFQETGEYMTDVSWQLRCVCVVWWCAFCRSVSYRLRAWQHACCMQPMAAQHSGCAETAGRHPNSSSHPRQLRAQHACSCLKQLPNCIHLLELLSCPAHITPHASLPQQDEIAKIRKPKWTDRRWVGDVGSGEWQPCAAVLAVCLLACS